jgi:hypothetical protein
LNYAHCWAELKSTENDGTVGGMNNKKRLIEIVPCRGLFLQSRQAFKKTWRVSNAA